MNFLTNGYDTTTVVPRRSDLPNLLIQKSLRNDTRDSYLSSHRPSLASREAFYPLLLSSKLARTTISSQVDAPIAHVRIVATTSWSQRKLAEDSHTNVRPNKIRIAIDNLPKKIALKAQLGESYNRLQGRGQLIKKGNPNW